MNIFDKRYYYSREFTNLPTEDQVRIILERADDVFAPQDSPWLYDGVQTYLVTIYLRSDCGCPTSVLDELTGEMIEIDTHDRGCLKVRFPICEDLSDKALARRRKRECLKDHSGFTVMEETKFA